MALIPPFFLDTVVAVGFAGPDDNPQYVATGFLFGQFVGQSNNNDEKTYAVFLVTNRHVFKSQQTAFLRFNPESGEAARLYKLDLVDQTGETLWLAHADPDVDVAVIPINARLLREEGIRFECFGSDQHIAPRSKAVEIGVTEGDQVFVLGFPLGLIGEGQDYVIVRHGAIARVRDCLESKQKTFLIDCSIFPGNSGGPVVTRPEILAIEGTKHVATAYLVGIVASYVPYSDVAISQQTGLPRIIFEENSGLASVFPIDYVQELIGEAVSRKTEPPVTTSVVTTENA